MGHKKIIELERANKNVSKLGIYKEPVWQMLEIADRLESLYIKNGNGKFTNEVSLIASELLEKALDVVMLSIDYGYPDDDKEMRECFQSDHVGIYKRDCSDVMELFGFEAWA